MKRPVIDARANQSRLPKSTHKASMFYHDITLPCYCGKVNVHVNIHFTYECCHVAMIKRKARQKARCKHGNRHGAARIAINGHRRPHTRTQGARGIRDTGKKGKARSGHSTGFIGLFNIHSASARPLRRSTERKHSQCVPYRNSARAW